MTPIGPDPQADDTERLPHIPYGAIQHILNVGYAITAGDIEAAYKHIGLAEMEGAPCSF